MPGGGSLGPIGLPSGVSWEPPGHIGPPLEPLEKSLDPFRSQTFDYGTLFGASWRFLGAIGLPSGIPWQPPIGCSLVGPMVLGLLMVIGHMIPNIHMIRVVHDAACDTSGTDAS